MLQEDILLNRIIKSLETVTILAEYESDNHNIEFGEKDRVFFVNLDGALLYAGKNGEEALQMFYNQVGKIKKDEENGADPDFSTLREILISRSPHIKRSLARLGQNALSNSVDDVLDNFLKQAEPDPQVTVEDYTSQNFEICPNAKTIFTRLADEVTSESKESILDAMKATDSFLGIEKKVIENKSASIDDIREMSEAIQDTQYFAGEVGEIIGDDLTDDFNFVTGHLMAVLEYYQTEESVEKQLAPTSNEVDVSIPAPEVDKWHTHDKEELLENPEVEDDEEDIDTNHVVKAIITGSDNTVLLLKDIRTPFWDLPGGHVQEGESLQEALHREVKEETNLIITTDKKLFTRDMTVGNPPTEQKRITFFVASVIGDISISDDLDMKAWVPVDELRRFNMGSFTAALTDSLKRMKSDDVELKSNEEKFGPVAAAIGGAVAGGILGKGNEGFAQITDASESEVDNVHNYSPSEKEYGDKAIVREGENKTVKTRDPDPKVSELVNKAGGGYGEAGGPKQREKNPIDPTGDEDDENADNAGRNALATVETPASQAFGSGAVIDLPDDEADMKGVEKEGAGGVGSGGEGVGASGVGSALSHSEVANPTYGSGTRPRKQAGSGGGRLQEDYDSNLNPLHKQTDASTMGAFEGISTIPADGEMTDRKTTAKNSSRYEYGEQERIDFNRGRNTTLPPEQRALGQGETSVWLSEDGKPRFKADEDTENILPDGSRSRTIVEPKKSPNFDPAVEQYTNLSDDHPFKSFQPFVVKSADSPDTIKDYAILSSDPFAKMDVGKTLVVAGWGSVYVVDREGHKISLNGLRKALKNFLANPEFANVNIFHSGIQVGKMLPSFVDKNGKTWKSHVNDKGMFAVVAFRTDLEVSRRAMSEVIKGNLRGFSLAGNSNPATKEIKCDHGKCWQEINDLEIYELTLCQEPMNQESWITNILQEPDANVCPECYDSPPQAKRYDSNMRPVS